MSASVPHPRAVLDPAAVEILLCDADGNLFPSEDPAFVASARVTNDCLAELGIDRRAKSRGLHALKNAGLVRVARERGRPARVALAPNPERARSPHHRPSGG